MARQGSRTQAYFQDGTCERNSPVFDGFHRLQVNEDETRVVSLFGHSRLVQVSATLPNECGARLSMRIDTAGTRICHGSMHSSRKAIRQCDKTLAIQFS